jgi:NADH:ubiquinone oxidoreductase subunit 6 (subunit J)
MTMPPNLLAAGPTAAGENRELVWSLVVTLFTGAAAVWLLLPRPRPYPWFYGAACGALALLLAAVLVVPAAGLTPEVVLFYAFSAVAILSGALLVTQHNPARAALSFALVVLSTCGLFLLLAAPFLMAATIIIYAGAIIVTFLFVLMLAQQSGRSDADVRSREPLLATLSGFLLLGALVYVIHASFGGRDIERLLYRTQVARAQGNLRDMMDKLVEKKQPPQEDLFVAYHDVFRSRWPDLNRAVDDLELAGWGKDPPAVKAQLDQLIGLAEQAQYRLATLTPPASAPLSAFSGPAANTPPAELRRDPSSGRLPLPAENSAYLGRSLFTDFLLPVELGGTLLLVATVGAIAVAHRRSPNARAS